MNTYSEWLPKELSILQLFPSNKVEQKNAHKVKRDEINVNAYILLVAECYS